MSTKVLIATPGSRGTPLSVIGTSITVLASAKDSQDQQITLQSGDEGMGPPPHSHDWTESFYVTRGQVQFTCSGETTMCPAGSFVYVPAGTVHAFSYGPGGGEFLEVTGVGSRAVEMFIDIDRKIPPGPPDVAKVVQTLGAHGVEVKL